MLTVITIASDVVQAPMTAPLFADPALAARRADRTLANAREMSMTMSARRFSWPATPAPP